MDEEGASGWGGAISKVFIVCNLDSISLSSAVWGSLRGNDLLPQR